MDRHDDLHEKVQSLTLEIRHLGRWVFFLWPGAWMVSVILMLAATRSDAAATNTFLQWLEGVVEHMVVPLLALLFLVGCVLFLLKVIHDFRHRRERFYPNPGSPRRSGGVKIGSEPTE